MQEVFSSIDRITKNPNVVFGLRIIHNQWEWGQFGYRSTEHQKGPISVVPILLLSRRSLYLILGRKNEWQLYLIFSKMVTSDLTWIKKYFLGCFRILLAVDIVSACDDHIRSNKSCGPRGWKEVFFSDIKL